MLYCGIGSISRGKSYIGEGSDKLGAEAAELVGLAIGEEDGLLLQPARSKKQTMRRIGYFFTPLIVKGNLTINQTLKLYTFEKKFLLSRAYFLGVFDIKPHPAFWT